MRQTICALTVAHIAFACCARSLFLHIVAYFQWSLTHHELSRPTTRRVPMRRVRHRGMRGDTLRKKIAA